MTKIREYSAHFNFSLNNGLLSFNSTVPSSLTCIQNVVDIFRDAVDDVINNMSPCGQLQTVFQYYLSIVLIITEILLKRT